MSAVLLRQGQDVDAMGINPAGWKVIIAGSRTITQRKALDRAIANCPFKDRITLVISGGEPNGVDRLGEQWAREHNIAILPVPADWPQYGTRAGPIRNSEMVKQADALILVWTGDAETSPGSADVLEKAKRKGIRVHEFKVAVVG